MKQFKLDNEPKIKSGFKTPDQYFENFSEKIMLQLPKEETKVISIFQKNKKFILVAAAILVFALLIPLANNYTSTAKELDETTLENYLSYQSNINQYDLINVLDEGDIDNIKTTVAVEDNTIEDLLVENGNIEHLILE